MTDIDWPLADQAARRIVLAYDLADVLHDYAESDERRAEGITIAIVQLAFGMLALGITEKQAISEFGKAFRRVRRHAKIYGDDVRLRDVITEMHL